MITILILMDKKDSDGNYVGNTIQDKESCETVEQEVSKIHVSKKDPPKSRILVPFLIFDGTCEEAFRLYKSVFDGEFTGLTRYKDAPEIGEVPVPSSELWKIMHVSLAINKEIVLMGSDRLEKFWEVSIPGNVSSIFLNAFSKSDADNLFNGLSSGGKVEMPLKNTLADSYIGMLTDKFGIHWILCFDQKKID